jgi:hypothetical protein
LFFFSVFNKQAKTKTAPVKGQFPFGTAKLLCNVEFHGACFATDSNSYEIKTISLIVEVNVHLA